MSYTGYVYQAKTNKPLVGIVVSDGRNVVKTAEDGFFKLEGWELTHFIMITVPSGYKGNYYIPISEENKSYDFYLEEVEQPNTHCFVQVSDTEINGNGAGEWLEHVKKVVKEEKPAFLIHTGDICGRHGLKRHIIDMNDETMGCPVKYILGNHDFVDDQYGEYMFEQIYGPTWYSFDFGNIHYCITPILCGDCDSGYDRADNFRWLKNDLAMVQKDKKVIIFNHDICTDENGYVIEFDGEKLDLRSYGLIAWIFGHYHSQYVSDNNGILNISTSRPDCGGIDQSASGTRVLRIDENNRLTTELRFYEFDGPTTIPNAAWMTQLGGRGLYSDPIIINGTLYVGTDDDDFPKKSAIYCVNTETGAVKWSYPTKNSVKNQMAYHNNKILAQDCQGYVYCINAQNGSLIWTRQISLYNPTHTAINVLVDGDILYAGAGNWVYAFDVENGESKWVYKYLDGENSTGKMRVCENTLLVSANWRRLFGLNKETGEFIWENRGPKLRYRSSTPLCVVENFYIASVDSLLLISGNTGEILHETMYEGYNFDVTAEPVLVKGTDFDYLYISTANKGVIAVRLDTYEIVWNYVTEEALIYTAPYSMRGVKTVEGTPAVLQDHIYFGASDGYLYCLNRFNGEVLSKINVDAPIFTAVVPCDQGIIALDFWGRLAKYEI